MMNSSPILDTVSTFPDRVLRPPGHLLQQLIAGVMAEPVVYGFEVVEVHEHDTGPGMLALRPPPRRLEPVDEKFKSE